MAGSDARTEMALGSATRPKHLMTQAAQLEASGATHMAPSGAKFSALFALSAASPVPT